MRRLASIAALLACIGSAHAQTPVFDSIQAGNLPINVAGAPYNAKCDGTTNDSAAIQSAINAGTGSGKSFALMFPPGTCLFNSTLTANVPNPYGMTIKGAGRAATQLIYTGAADAIDVTMNPSTGLTTQGPFDIADLTLLATGTAQTALALTSPAPNSVSPGFRNIRITYTGSGSFANGIATANMSNIFADTVIVESPNTTGIAFKLDGNSTFPSINDHFADLYVHGFATGVQIGNGTTTAYAQGVVIANSIIMANKSCILWDDSGGSPQLADMLLVTNTHCNPASGGTGGIVTNNVQNVVVGNNYFIAAGLPAISITSASSYTIHGNAFNANNAASSNAVSIFASHGSVVGNSFLNFATSSRPVVFAAGSVGNTASSNRCDGCSNWPMVADFGTNIANRNVNNGFATGPNTTTSDQIDLVIRGQQQSHWLPGSSPAFSLEGSVLGWNYQGQGETDVFLSRGAGGANGYSMVWYDTTAGSVGTQLMGLSINGNLTVPGLVTGVGYHAGASTGLSCSGTPTSSFASVGGIVTHC